MHAGTRRRSTCWSWGVVVQGLLEPDGDRDQRRSGQSQPRTLTNLPALGGHCSYGQITQRLYRIGHGGRIQGKTMSKQVDWWILRIIRREGGGGVQSHTVMLSDKSWSNSILVIFGRRICEKKAYNHALFVIHYILYKISWDPPAMAIYIYICLLCEQECLIGINAW